MSAAKLCLQVEHDERMDSPPKLMICSPASCLQVSTLISKLHQAVVQRLACARDSAEEPMSRIHRTACSRPAFALSLTCPPELYEVLSDPDGAQLQFRDVQAVLDLVQAAVLRAWHAVAGDRLLQNLQVGTDRDTCGAAARAGHLKHGQQLLPASRSTGASLQAAAGSPGAQTTSASKAVHKRKHPSLATAVPCDPATSHANADGLVVDPELEELLQQPLSPLEVARPTGERKRRRAARLQPGQDAAGITSDRLHQPGSRAMHVHSAPAEGLCVARGMPQGLTGWPRVIQQGLRCSGKLQACSTGHGRTAQQNAGLPGALAGENTASEAPRAAQGADNAAAASIVGLDTLGRHASGVERPGSAARPLLPSNAQQICLLSGPAAARGRLHERYLKPPAWQGSRRECSAPSHAASRWGTAPKPHTGSRRKQPAVQADKVREASCNSSAGASPEQAASWAEQGPGSQKAASGMGGRAGERLPAASSGGAASGQRSATKHHQQLAGHMPAASPRSSTGQHAVHAAGAALLPAAQPGRLEPAPAAAAAGGAMQPAANALEPAKQQQPEPESQLPASAALAVATEGVTATARASAPGTPIVQARPAAEAPSMLTEATAGGLTGADAGAVDTASGQPLHWQSPRPSESVPCARQAPPASALVSLSSAAGLLTDGSAVAGMDIGSDMRGHRPSQMVTCPSSALMLALAGAGRRLAAAGSDVEPSLSTCGRLRSAQRSNGQSASGLEPRKHAITFR